MKPPAILVAVSRGGLIDTNAPIDTAPLPPAAAWP